jgi:hypothetical protein
MKNLWQVGIRKNKQNPKTALVIKPWTLIKMLQSIKYKKYAISHSMLVTLKTQLNGV